MAGILRPLAVAACMAAFWAALWTAPAAAQPTSSPDFALETLEPQTLNVGECGMFLWTRATQPELVIVAWDKPGLVRFRGNGRIYNLPRVSFGGEMASGHFERQRFSDGTVTVQIDVTFDQDRQLRDGAYVRNGIMRVTSRRGWQTVVPVGGLAACQREADQPNRR